MKDPLTTVSTRETPQSRKIKGTVPNSAGGFAFPVDHWTRLQRFLVLGSEGGTYYITEQALTRENAEALFTCIAKDGPRTVSTIVDISVAGRNVKQNPVLFALAACAGADDLTTRQAALDAIPLVCRTGTHLFLFARYVEQFRGWGRGLREAIGKWYLNQDNLNLQLVKYRQREGWSHRDLLRLSKPKPRPRDGELDRALGWATGKVEVTQDDGMLWAADEIQKVTKPKEAIKLIGEYRLPWEAVPDQFINDPDVLRALVPQMGLGALVRQLNRLTIAGVIKPLSKDLGLVIDRLTDAEGVHKSRIHPMAVLVALRTYANGKGVRGSQTWTPVGDVTDALDTCFRLAFPNVEPANKRTMLCLDVSASMGWNTIAGTFIKPSEGSAAMALITAATERQNHIMAFSHELVPVTGITSKSSLQSAMRAASRITMGGTDCSAPMTYALSNGIECDTFVVYTDSETWAGKIHPSQALRKYRERTGIPAKLVVVGMVSNGFSIADPNDSGMLDVVGFDTAAPKFINDFSAGRV